MLLGDLLMNIGQCNLDDEVYIIAEIGGNHNGNPKVALELVQAAANSKVNAVKFQTYHAETLVLPDLEPLPLVRKSYGTQAQRFKSLELDLNVYDELRHACRELKIDFLTTPFDLQILDQFAPYMPAIKVASGDLTHHPLIEQAATYGKPVILSTGMATIGEIDAAACLVPKHHLALLHCVSIYPLPDEKVNLRGIAAMQQRWPEVTIGYSDHTVGPEACLAAVALGARIVEKHFTLDTRQTPGDHVLSLDPQELTDMVNQIRRVERMLGTFEKKPAIGEESMRVWMRRSIYAKRTLKAGDTITGNDLLFLRPFKTSTPADALLLVGRRLRRDVAEFQEMLPELVE